jgi:hypothetical protein
MEAAADQALAQAAAFQKMWMDAFSGMAEVWTRASPGQPPNEAIRDMRAGMLKILTQSWEEFMRSPQFLEYMKQSMDGFMTIQKYSADAMTRGRQTWSLAELERAAGAARERRAPTGFRAAAAGARAAGNARDPYPPDLAAPGP